MAKLSYAIVGPGALGTLFAARLTRAGHAVELIARSPDRAEALSGSPVEIVEDGISSTVTVAYCDISGAREADVVLFCTKGPALAAAADRAAAVFASAQFVAIQNGLGHADTLIDRVGVQRVTFGVTMAPADLHGTHRVETRGAGLTWLGARVSAAGPISRQICAELTGAGSHAEYVENPDLRVWNKAGFNVAMNALCALTHGSPGLLGASVDGQLLAHEVADEVIAVATATGADIDDKAIHDLIDMACAQHRYHKPSMLQDLEHARITEIETLNGFVERLGAANGVAVPNTRMLARLIRIREQAPAFWAEAPQP